MGVEGVTVTVEAAGEDAGVADVGDEAGGAVAALTAAALCSAFGFWQLPQVPSFFQLCTL